MSTTTTGLPSANMARASSFCSPTRSRLVASPMCLASQASRLTAALPPTNNTMASASFATLTASAMRTRFSSGLASFTSSIHQSPWSVMRTPSACTIFNRSPSLLPDAFEHGDDVFRHIGIAADLLARGVRADDRQCPERRHLQRQRAVVLQQHHRLACGLGASARASSLLVIFSAYARIGVGMLEQPREELQAQHAPHRRVDLLLA